MLAPRYWNPYVTVTIALTVEMCYILHTLCLLDYCLHLTVRVAINSYKYFLNPNRKRNDRIKMRNCYHFLSNHFDSREKEFSLFIPFPLSIQT